MINKKQNTWMSFLNFFELFSDVEAAFIACICWKFIYNL